MAKRVSKEERETIIRFDETDGPVVIYTFNADLKRRLKAKLPLQHSRPQSLPKKRRPLPQQSPQKPRRLQSLPKPSPLQSRQLLPPRSNSSGDCI